ncbi:unnamed protein product [Parascedosporium putredinis]|uniref:Uncharacterized protein n=1 Tax=Parascedosporium putredinis TaxID=1442378 RepID=A0A9P1MFC7_9PEZI|nr:unnamed protein product [Parascedosporium putredinis]CAI8004774.1 unnamed protein product [Parascedosporium putredinis]
MSAAVEGAPASVAKSVEDYVSSREEVEPTLRKFQEMISWDDDEPIETTFELNDTLYTKAQIPPTEEVFIWLGTMEVALARVYNWDVVQKRKEKTEEEEDEGKGKGKTKADE